VLSCAGDENLSELFVPVAPPEHRHEARLETSGNLPVAGVDWPDAQAYCRWVEMRLPTRRNGIGRRGTAMAGRILEAMMLHRRSTRFRQKVGESVSQWRVGGGG
jgi:hypothetical protein